MDDLGYIRPDFLKRFCGGGILRMEIISILFFMNPKVKFKIDPKKDLVTAKSFINESIFDDGRNLEWVFFKKYPELRGMVKDAKDTDYKFLNRFIAKKYKENREVAVNNFKNYEMDWQKIEKKYFVLVGDLFPGVVWPKGKYIAYATIWGMFPRFLEDKTFQIPIKYRSRRYVSVIIAHEMLHFMFYEHIKRNYPQYKDPEHSFLVWHISEIFNSLIQDSPTWLKVFKKKTMPYPEHEKVIMALRKQHPDPAMLKAGDLIQKITPIAVKLMK